MIRPKRKIETKYNVLQIDLPVSILNILKQIKTFNVIDIKTFNVIDNLKRRNFFLTKEFFFYNNY